MVYAEAIKECEEREKKKWDNCGREGGLEKMYIWYLYILENSDLTIEAEAAKSNNYLHFVQRLIACMKTVAAHFLQYHDLLWEAARRRRKLRTQKRNYFRGSSQVMTTCF